MRAEPGAADRRTATSVTVGAAVAVVLAASSCDALAAPTALRTALTAAAVLATVAPFEPRRRLVSLDHAAAVVAVAVILAIGLGFVLSVVPGGLTRVSWSVGFGVTALGVIGYRGRTATSVVAAPAATSLPSRHLVRQVGWGLASLAVVAGALVIGTRSMRAGDQAPLQLSALPAGSSAVSLVVTGHRSSGPYDLVAVRGSRSTVLVAALTVSSGRSFTRVVPVPVGGERVELQDAVTHAAVRSVVVDP